MNHLFWNDNILKCDCSSVAGSLTHIPLLHHRLTAYIQYIKSTFSALTLLG